MADNIWDAKINVDIDAAGSQRALAGLVKGFNDLERGIEDSEAAMRKNEARIEHLEGAAKSVAAAMRKMDGAIDQSNSGLRQQAAEAQRTERAIRSLYQEYASGQMKMGKTPAKMSAWLPTSGIPASDLAQVSNANLAVNSTVAQALREQERAHEAAARAAERQAEATRRLRLQQEAALTKAQGRLDAENEAEGYRKLEATVGRAEAAKKRLAMAQREVNAAQNALRGAVGDIVAQTAATNRLADAKRKLAQAEVAARTAQQPVGNPDSARYALYDVAATTGTGAAIGGIAIGATIKNYALLDSQLAIVSRTSALTGHNMDVLGESLLDMGSRIPVSLQGLTDMAARAAQLGVEGSSNILAFTETMSKFAAVSDTVTETEVAEYFGRLSNLTGGNDSWESLADSVAKVGINSAATDQQILKTAQEVAQAAAGANYAADEIIGLSGAFASLGIPPERARSVLLDFNKIMTKGMGESTESMKMLSAQMGISEDAIRDMWRAKPTELISGMSKAMKDMAPEEAMKFLQDFGLKGQRALPVFLALAKDAKAAGDGISVLDRALADADFDSSAGELDKQFAKTMETLTAAWQMFVNSLQNVGFEAMAALGPVLADVLNNAGDLLDWAVDFVRSPIGGFVSTLVVSLAGLATALLGVVTMGTMAAASFLAITTAAKQMQGTKFASLFAPFAGGGMGKSSALATAASGVAVLGNNAKVAAPHVTSIGKSGLIAAPYLKDLGTQATFAQRAVATGGKAWQVGGKAISGLVGAIGPANLAFAGAALGIGYIAQSAATAETETRALGRALTTVSEAGEALSVKDMFKAAEDSFRTKNPIVSALTDFSDSISPGAVKSFEFDEQGMAEYAKYLREITTADRGGSKVTESIFGFNPNMGPAGAGRTEGAKAAAQNYNEIGNALAKMNSKEAAIAFKQLNDEWVRGGGVTEDLVTALGGNFSTAMWDAGSAAGALKGEMGGANQNLELGKYVLSEYSATAGGAKDRMQELYPVLEQMSESFTGAFSGMAENAAQMNGLFGGLINGASAATNLKAAIEGLKVVNEETGEATGEVIDIFNEQTGQFDLTTAAAQNALGSLGAYAEGQIASAQANYQWLEAMVGSDEALRQTQASMDAARQTFIDSAVAMGIPVEQATKLADAMGLIPGEKFIIVDAGTADTATEKVKAVRQALVDIPVDTPVQVTGLTEAAKARLEAIGYQVSDLDENGNATVTVTADTYQASADLAALTVPRTVTVTAEVRSSGDLYSTSPYGNAGQKFGADGGMIGTGRKFAGGGYTGTGGKWDPAGMAHRGEYIFPKRTVDQARGIPSQDSLGRMMAQHYPQAMAPTVVVQGGGQGGPVDLSIGSIQALAQAVYTQINIDGMALANNVNGQNRTSTRKSSN